MPEMIEKTYNRDDVVFKEGARGSSIFRVLSGRAAVWANYGTDDAKLLTELHEGDYFGEMAVIEIARRSATVVAAEDGTRLAETDAFDLDSYLTAHPDEIAPLARHLSRRLRELTGDYTEVCDTLRELGRLDTSADRVNEGLLQRIRKFARVHLMGGNPAGDIAEPVVHVASRTDGKELAVHSVAYRQNDVIFHEEDRSDCMYYIHTGRVGIYTAYGTDRQKLLTELTASMFFGEMGLFEGRVRTASAVALEDDTWLEVIHEKDLAHIYEKSPELALMVLQHLSSRLRRLTSDYLKACKTLAETEKEIEERQCLLTPDLIAQAEFLNRLLLAPEIMF